MKMLRIACSFFLLTACNQSTNKNKKEVAVEKLVPAVTVPSAMSDNWHYVGESINEPGYDIWGSSPVRDDEGKVHLFSARWSAELPFTKAWRYNSELAHYVSDTPEGPFKFVEVVPGTDKNEGWKSVGFHNPNIKKIGNKYALVFIANDGDPNHGPNQRIGMMISENINGPWRFVPENEPLLSPPKDAEMWCYQSGCGVNNPSLLAHPNGKFYLYFKAMTGPRPEGKIKMGVAVADRLEGPYIIHKQPITANDRAIEDGYAFLWRDKICLLTTDNHGILEEGGGLLWSSDDGVSFNSEPLSGFHNFSDFYLKGKLPDTAIAHYGPEDNAKFERPQILLDANGEPEYLYCPSGVAIDGSDGTNNYVLRYKKNNEK